MDIPWTSGGFSQLPLRQYWMTGELLTAESEPMKKAAFKTGWQRPISSYAHPLFNKENNFHSKQACREECPDIATCGVLALTRDISQTRPELIFMELKAPGVSDAQSVTSTWTVPEIQELRELLDGIWEMPPTPGQCVLGTRGLRPGVLLEWPKGSWI